MVRELLTLAVKKYGGDTELVDKLLLHDGKQYFTWAMRSLVDPMDTYNSIFALSEVFNVPVSKVSYAYFSASSVSRYELSKLPEYVLVMDTLNSMRSLPQLWDSMSLFCYRQLKRLCIDELVAKDLTAKQIMGDLNVSNGLVYTVRSEHIFRELSKYK